MARLWATVTAFAALLGTAAAADLTLAQGGKAKCVIVVPQGSLAEEPQPDQKQKNKKPGDLPHQAAALLQERQHVYRDSINDLALYLGKISGTKVEIVEGLPAGEKRIPVYVGAEAQKVFGPVGKPRAGLVPFRVVAGKKGVGLYGESDYGTSYAIYELLHRLGCRWFMPTELGEVVPAIPTLVVPEMDKKLAPATVSRGMWHGGADFLRRNRMGRDTGDIAWLAIGDGALERFFTAQDLEAHSEWRAIQADGKPHSHALRLTHPGVAEHVAGKILAQLETVYEPILKAGFRPGYALTPGDFQVPTEDCAIEAEHEAEHEAAK